MGSDFLGDVVVVAAGGIAADEFAQKTGHEELCAQHHHGQGDVEVGGVGHEWGSSAGADVVEFVAAHDEHGQQAEEEHERAEEAEHVHGLEAETVEKPQREEVEIAVDEAVEAHELRLSELAGLVLHHLFADAAEAGVLGQVGDVAVHLAVDFDVLDHVLAIGFQSAVEVVEVVDAAHLSCRGVEEFGGEGFGDGVVAFLLVAAHQVVAFFRNHAVELGDFVGAVLEVGVHGDDHFALCGAETAEEGGTLPVVAAELDAVHRGVLGAEVFDESPRAVGRPIVHKNEFMAEVVVGHDAFDPSVKFGDAFVFVEEGDDDGDVNAVVGGHRE